MLAVWHFDSHCDLAAQSPLQSLSFRGSITIWTTLVQCYHVTLHYLQPFQFPIETDVEELSNKCLHHALSADRHPHLLVSPISHGNNPEDIKQSTVIYWSLFQYLGHLDLYLLASQQPLRRALVFSLTNLGGHALNWTQLSKVCLQRLEVLQQTIAAFNQRIIAGVPLQQAPRGGE